MQPPILTKQSAATSKMNFVHLIDAPFDVENWHKALE